MPVIVKALSIGAGSLVVAVSVYLGLTNVTAKNYPGAILTHLVDIVQGNSTKTVVATNAPAWGFGEQMASPIAVSATNATNTAATLASSTPYYFEVAALDGNGTTTPSASLKATTDASTTDNVFFHGPEGIHLTWSGVVGATGYAVYFSTSTPKYDQYFLATSTASGRGSYDFATSTGSFSGTDTLTDNTAFGIHLNQNGRSWLNNSTTATSSVAASTTVLQVGGTINAVAPATTTACEADTAGAVFYNLANSHEWGCSGSAWVKIF